MTTAEIMKITVAAQLTVFVVGAMHGYTEWPLYLHMFVSGVLSVSAIRYLRKGNGQ